MLQFGPVPPKKLATQDPFKVLLLAERWQRASTAHQSWAKRAMPAFDFFEGRHYTAEQIAKLAGQGRPHFKFNNIGSLVRLVQGYFGNHKTDITYRPGNDARSSQNVGDALTALEKAIALGCELEFVDVEVFLDGLVGGRGFFDTRLTWEDNDLGELMTRASDPFGTYIDPDASTYDLNKTASFLQTSKMVSIDEIEATMGKQASELIRPFTFGQTPSMPISTYALTEELTPIRYFGERADATDWWDQFYGMMGDFCDTYRKTIRIIETQYKVREPRNVIIDLETGDKKTLPEDWDNDKIAKVLLYCQSINNPCVVENRLVERVHWTTMVGDLILYDAPSLYDRYTISGYFPYFRRGFTKGMVEDLIDPQMEKNKRRNAQIEIVGRTANGGWIYHENSLTPQQKRNLKKFGSTPGVNIEWKGNDNQKPVPIEMGKSPIQHERLEQEADQDFHAISGINPSALGEIDRVQSGRAIQARTQQAVLSVQTYFDNFKRAKVLLGRAHLAIVQAHYTEPRFYRVLGEDSKLTQLLINQQQQDPSSGIKRILNDVTVGKYMVVVDPAPLSASFQQAQFEEMMDLLDKLGPAGERAVPAVIDLIIGMTTMPQKDEWIARLQKALAGSNQPPPPKVAEAISFKDLPPEGKVQMAAQAGIKIGLPAPEPQPGAPQQGAPAPGAAAPPPAGIPQAGV